MSVVGIDLGNDSCVVALARRKGIDVVLNNESNRQTPGMVSFGSKQRFLGTGAAAQMIMNPKNTVSQMKRLIGRKFSDPDVQVFIKRYPFHVVQGPNDSIEIEASSVNFMGESQRFSPERVLAMLLSELKDIAESNQGGKVTDCVLGIPAYFIDPQRRGVLDAATIAGFNCLRLMHESTATALGYGIYKTDLPENDPVNVAFVDIGHSNMQVCVVAFRKGQLKVLSHAFDRNLGGKDFDEVLFDHFADEFLRQTGDDVRGNARASLRLRAGSEKVKKVLSANAEAPLNVECLMNDRDFRSLVRRDDFEQWAAPVLNRVIEPCKRAVEESGVTLEQIASVEVVGSGSRVPAVLKILQQFFGKELSRTLNAEESVARGCALQCAMLSPAFKVREFEVIDVYPYSVSFTWTNSGDAGNALSTTVVFPKGNPIPSTKMLTFYRNDPFTIEAHYTDPKELPEGVTARIGTFHIGPFPQPKDGGKAKIKVKVRLNLHGIVTVESAQMLEEEEYEETVNKTPEAKGAEAQPMATDDNKEASAEAKPADEKMDEAAPSNADSDKPQIVKKTRVRRTDIPVKAETTGLPPADLAQAVEKEFDMKFQDKIMEETKERKNAVEAYVYSMRNQLTDKLADFATPEQKEALLGRLQETEDWLYDEGEDESKGVYVSKLEELQKFGDPIEERAREYETRPAATQLLSEAMNSYRQMAQTNDERFAHIDPAEKAKVLKECDDISSWLQDKTGQQSQLNKTDPPALLTQDIEKKRETLERFCKPILSKPKPKPKEEEKKPAPAPEAKPAEQQQQQQKTGGEQPADAMETDEKTDEGPSPMQADLD
eukprot:jgi/Chlat1/7749/Chrsp66S07221